MPADRLITVNVIAEGQRNQYGEYVPGATTAFRTWATRQDLSQEDKEQEGGIRDETRRDWRIRWDSRIAVTPVSRLEVVDGGLTFNVLNLLEVTGRPGGDVTPAVAGYSGSSRNMKLWPFGGSRETRESGGDFADAVVRLIEAQAARKVADTGSTAAVEAASGALARSFASATVDGPEYAQKAVSPVFLAQVGRDLVRRGKSLHVIQVDAVGGVELVPCASWHWEGNHNRNNWTVRATALWSIHVDHLEHSSVRCGIRDLGRNARSPLHRHFPTGNGRTPHHGFNRN